MKRRNRRGLVAVIAAMTLGGCTATIDIPATIGAAGDTSTGPGRSPRPVEHAPSTIADLPVKGRAPKTGYSRAQFGQAWSDDVSVSLGHNGCDTRNDILRRDLTRLTLKPGTRDCVVLTGTLQDPYTGATLTFVRGARSSSVQVDHVVSLSNAWQTGAQTWTPQKRRNFANDPRNLLAVDGPANQAKGAGDAATWLPPNKSYRCTYVARQVAVKHVYGLWVSPAEHSAMQRLLASCRSTTHPR